MNRDLPRTKNSTSALAPTAGLEHATEDVAATCQQENTPGNVCLIKTSIRKKHRRTARQTISR